MIIVRLSVKTVPAAELIAFVVAIVWDQTIYAGYVDVGLKGNCQTLLFHIFF